VQVRGVSAPWHVLSATAGDTDLFEEPLSVESGRDVPEIVVTLTSRPTVLEGSVVDADGTPRTDTSVIVFPAEVIQAVHASRRIAAAQPDINGHYEFTNLPPGRYQIVCASIDWDPWVEPDRLLTLVSRAQRVDLRAGEQVELTLSVQNGRVQTSPSKRAKSPSVDTHSEPRGVVKFRSIEDMRHPDR
jgi:hypothetical protein